MFLKFNTALRPFYIFQAGQFVSRFGSKATAYGLVLWAYAQSGSVLSTTLLTVCTIAPLFLLSFVFGSLGDKWDRKTMILLADAAAAVCSVLTLILLLSGQLRVWHLYLINLLLGISDAFQGPAVSSALSSLVPAEKYAETSGFRSLCNAVVDIFCPMLATSLYALYGLFVLIVFDLATFLFAALTLFWLIEIPPATGAPAEHESALDLCVQGIHYLAAHRGMLYLLLYKAAINFSAALTRTLLTPMVLSRGGDEFQLGLVSGLAGAAAVLGSIVTTRMHAPKRRISQMMGIMIVCSIPGFFLAFGRNAWWWGLGQLLGSIPIPLWVAHIDVLMRTCTPVSMHSRLFAAEETLKQGSLVLGMVLSGVLCDSLLEPAVAALAQAPQSLPAKLLDALVGLTPGGGMALLFAVSSLLCIGFSVLFGRIPALQKLDEPIESP